MWSTNNDQQTNCIIIGPWKHLSHQQCFKNSMSAQELGQKKCVGDSLATCSWKMCSTVVVNQSLGLFDWGLSEMDNCKLWLEYLPCIRHVKISWTEKIYSTNCKNPLESKSKRETTIIHSIQWACLHPARNIYANLLNWTSLPFNTF